MTFIQQLEDRARRLGRRIALPESTDPRILDAAVSLSRSSVAVPVLVGPGAEIDAALASLGARGEVEIADVDADREAWTERLRLRMEERGQAPADPGADAGSPLTRAVLMLASGDVDGVVAGAVHSTADVVRAGLKLLGLRPGVRTVSSSFYMEVPAFRSEEREVLTFTDAGVVPQPGPRQLAEIAAEAVRARRLVVGDVPRVAFLSYSTRGSAGGESVERVRAGLARFRELCPDVVVDGELQVDAALIPDVAAHKAPDSPLEGSANVLVFPSLDAANIAYKLVQRLAGATALGPILQGLQAPLNDLSRGARASDVVHVAAITSLMAE